jgi:hypothetical protein
VPRKSGITEEVEHPESAESSRQRHPHGTGTCQSSVHSLQSSPADQVLSVRLPAGPGSSHQLLAVSFQTSRHCRSCLRFVQTPSLFKASQFLVFNQPDLRNEGLFQVHYLLGLTWPSRAPRSSSPESTSSIIIPTRSKSLANCSYRMVSNYIANPAYNASTLSTSHQPLVPACWMLIQ